MNRSVLAGSLVLTVTAFMAALRFAAPAEAGKPPGGGASSEKADPAECNGVRTALDAARATVDAAVAQGGKSASEQADLMTDADSAHRKLTTRCKVAAKREGIEFHERWAQHVRERQEALRLCGGLATGASRPADPRLAELPGLADTLEQAGRATSVGNASRCIKALAPYGTTLAPNLAACLKRCRDARDKLSPVTPACAAMLTKVMARIERMEKAVANPAVEDVGEAFQTEQTKFMNNLDEVVAACKESDLAEALARRDLLGAQANAIDGYAKTKAARRDVKKDTGWSKVESEARNCMDSMFALPALDKRLAGYLEECRKLALEADRP